MLAYLFCRRIRNRHCSGHPMGNWPVDHEQMFECCCPCCPVSPAISFAHLYQNQGVKVCKQRNMFGFFKNLLKPRRAKCIVMLSCCDHSSRHDLVHDRTSGCSSTLQSSPLEQTRSDLDHHQVLIAIVAAVLPSS